VIERLTDHDGYLIRFSSGKPSPRAVLFLHGFPAHRGVKNLDLAQWVHEETGETTYVLHFRGLGESRGTFGFCDSVREATAVFDRLVSRERHQTVALVGHSFGGMVALNVAHTRPTHTDVAVLLSPLCYMEEGDPIYRWILEDSPKDWPGVFGTKTRSELVADMNEIGQKHLPSVLAPQISEGLRLAILQSATDDVTPALRARAILPSFRRPPEYLELPLDHSFTQDRALLARHVTRILLGKPAV
jgi:pimeloyl-ACP methyl ester carboxylesterase